ncbi:hypothetical protein MUP79_01665 [Candidatus Bathyarchaeota archaeon]|nr:hypothetical protein [Candidatus Bathyarchaeota archaeon]
MEQSVTNTAAQLDLTAFTKELGYKNAPFQEAWYNLLQNEFSPLKSEPNKRKKQLILWPRGHAKTETTSVNYNSWLVGKYPDIHINLVTKTSTLAQEILTALITRFEVDERYREIFGELKPQNAKAWNSSEIIVKRNEISKNPTIKATGLMGPITGGRSDLVICDDVIDEENVTSRLQIEKASTWVHKVLFPTLYPWGAIIFIGTRWSYQDLYSELMEKWVGCVDVKQAIQQDGTALWPEYWSIQKLEERKREIGTIFFQCQYQNDPTGMKGDLLKAEWLHTYGVIPNSLTYYAGVDPALGEGDMQAIATIGIDGQTKQVYLVEVWAETLPFPDFLAKLKEKHANYKYSKIWLESNAFQKVLMFIPELKSLPIAPSNTDKDKERRFIPMSSHFESNRILVNPLLIGARSEFWNQWVQFPRGRNDDALDAAEIAVRNTVARSTEFAYVIG